MTEPVGYEVADIANAINGVADNTTPMRTVPDLAADVIDLGAALKALTELRNDHLRRLHSAMAAAPKGGLEVELAEHGAVKIGVTKPVSRTKVKHDKLRGALDRLADTPAHRVDPATGEDLGRAAARLKLWDRCYSMAPRWSELEHLGLVSKEFCSEVSETKISISGDGVKVSPLKVPK